MKFRQYREPETLQAATIKAFNGTHDGVVDIAITDSNGMPDTYLLRLGDDGVFFYPIDDSAIADFGLKVGVSNKLVMSPEGRGASQHSKIDTGIGEETMFWCEVGGGRAISASRGVSGRRVKVSNNSPDGTLSAWLSPERTRKLAHTLLALADACE